MEFKDLLQKDIGDLKELLAQKQGEIRELRFQAFNGRLKKVKMIGVTRKAIAQITTALKQLEKNS